MLSLFFPLKLTYSNSLIYGFKYFEESQNKSRKTIFDKPITHDKNYVGVEVKDF